MKLQSLVIKSIKNSEQAPRKIRLFINKPTIGFSDAADLACAQELTLTESQLQGTPIQLKYALVSLLEVLLYDQQTQNFKVTDMAA